MPGGAVTHMQSGGHATHQADHHGDRSVVGSDIASVHRRQDVRLERGDGEAGAARQDRGFGEYRRDQREMGDAPAPQRDMAADEVDDVRWHVLHDLCGGVERKGFLGPDAARRKSVQNGRPDQDQQDRQERIGSAGEDEPSPQPSIPAQLAERGVLQHDAASEDQPDQGQSDPDCLQQSAPSCGWIRAVRLWRHQPSRRMGRTLMRTNAAIMPPPPCAVPFDPLVEPARRHDERRF